MRQFILRIKIPLESDYVYDYKRTGKIVYEIRLNQVVILDNSGLYLRINLVLRADLKMIKDMFEYSFFNLLQVNNDCRELEEHLEKIKKASNDLKRIINGNNKAKTKEMIFSKILNTCPEYCDNKWYPAQHMIQVDINSKKISLTIDLNQIIMKDTQEDK